MVEKRKILMVDDDEDDFILIRSMLEEIREHAYQVSWAASYQDGLEEIRACRWDAVLVDYDLGAENGVQLICEAGRSGCQSPLIMVTGRGNYEVNVEALQAGAMDYVSKVQINGPFLERVISYSIERTQEAEKSEAGLEEKIQELSETIEELQCQIEEQQVFKDELRQQNEAYTNLVQRLQGELTNLQGLLDHTPLGYLVTDEFGKILRGNATAALKLACAPEKLAGRLMAGFIELAYRAEFRRKLAALGVKGWAKQNWRVQVLPRDGEPFPALLIAAPALSSGDNLMVIHWLVHDLREG